MKFIIRVFMADESTKVKALVDGQVVSDDGKCLFVANVKEEHNHETSEESFQFYPKIRKLSVDQRSYAENIMALNVNKKTATTARI